MNNVIEHLRNCFRDVKNNKLKEIFVNIVLFILNIIFSIDTFFTFLYKKNNKNNNKKEQIRVGFLVQNAPDFNKIKPLYEFLLKNKKFKTFLLCVPYSVDSYKLSKDNFNNKSFEKFNSLGYDAINVLKDDDTLIDLDVYHLDYIFYQKPYFTAYPLKYHSNFVNKFTKICFVLYAQCMDVEHSDTELNNDFCRNVYLYFAENSYAKDLFDKKFYLNVKLGFSKSINVGMTSLVHMDSKRNDKSSSWIFSKNDYRIIWTPRWNNNKGDGGNFFLYKDLLINYAKSNLNIDLLIRPHPLAFSHYISTGEMKINEYENFISTINNMDNVSLDVQSDYASTFWNSSVLFTDWSSIIFDYFYTGKPIILTTTNFNLHIIDEIKPMIDCCYLADTKEKAFFYLYQIKNGIDYLKEKRLKVIHNLFYNAQINPIEKIAEELYNDYWNK